MVSVMELEFLHKNIPNLQRKSKKIAHICFVIADRGSINNKLMRVVFKKLLFCIERMGKLLQRFKTKN
jgi:hypothetical protein